LIGALPLLVAPVLDHAVAAWMGSTAERRVGRLSPLGSVTWINALLVLSLLVVSARVFITTSLARASHGPTWGCGYQATTVRMQYTASSVADWVVGLFGMVLRPRVRAPQISGPFPASSRFESHVPEVVLDLGILPLGRLLSRAAGWFRWIQHGSVHLYVLYVLAALVSMLFLWR
jgi:hypothetical protein